MSCAIFGFTLLLLVFGAIGEEMETDHCQKHLYTSKKEPMEYTKETSTEEFAIVGKFKGLHCCARGYRSLEWLKDGQPYPWPYKSVSGMILYPASANQTVYAHQVYPEDAGNYTCLLRNDTTIFSHTIQLHVYDKTPDEPKVTYLSSDAEVEVGKPVRLFCEAFVGQMDLPDAHNEAKWMRLDENNTSVDVEEEDRVRHEPISREENQTFGSYLTIDEVHDEDFGKYICQISKVGAETIVKIVQIREKVPVVYLKLNPIPWNKLLTISSVIAVTVFIIMLLYIRHGLRVRVHFKDRFGSEATSDNDKTKDALIVYSEGDSELALGVLLPTLETTYGYTCSSKEIKPSPSDNYASWQSYISESAQKCKRLIVVFSPSIVGTANWDAGSLKNALKQLNSVGLPVICVTLKQLPKSSSQIKDNQGESLSSVLKQVHVVPWPYHDNNGNDPSFWLSLRLRLPPKNNAQNQRNDIRHGSIIRQTSENNMMVDLCVPEAKNNKTKSENIDFRDIMV